MPPETKYFQTDRCLVTSTRAVLDGVTYAMSNITSVRGHKEDPNRMPSLILGALGGLLTLSGLSNAAFGQILLGILLVAAAVLIWRAQKPTYIVILGTAGKETHAQSGQDSAEIRGIINAIGKAIIERG